MGKSVLEYVNSWNPFRAHSEPSKPTEESEELIRLELEET